MDLEKKEYNRGLLVKEVLKELSNLVKRDQLMESVSIWIKFKQTGNEVPVYYSKFVKSFSNNFENRNLILNALNFTKKEYSRDNSLTLIKIDLKSKLETNRLGQILVFDISTPKKDH